MTDTTHSRRTTLLRRGNVHSPADPFATAMLVEGNRIAWVGSESAADSFSATADDTVDLDGALVTPAFTDAHVHTTATGAASFGLDLTAATSLADALDIVRAHARHAPTGHILQGHGWDTTDWPEKRAPGRTELDEAVDGRPLLLTRIDAHSAVATTALLDRVPGITELPGFCPDGPHTSDAHHALRAAARAAVTPAQRAAAQRAARQQAAALGIGSLHECGGPDIDGADDFTALLELAANEPGPRIAGYWGEAFTTAADVTARLRDLGAAGAGGDLFADGSIGSHTAHLHDCYADADHTGTVHLDAEAIADHLTACTEAGVQAGFHAIGDAALNAVTEGARVAAERAGAGRFRALRHRVEHAEALTPATVAAFADLALTASVQPAFDAAWGGDDGMYARRLGTARARTLNPYAALLRAGVPLALGSDSPVTPLDPWGAIRAAAFHRTAEHRISVRAAFTAHTRGGWRALGRDSDGDGVLTPGAVADYAVWHTTDLIVQAPEDRVARWSTDPRAGTPGLPDLTPGTALPQCLRTVVGGDIVHDRLNG